MMDDDDDDDDDDIEILMLGAQKLLKIFCCTPSSVERLDTDQVTATLPSNVGVPCCFTVYYAYLGHGIIFFSHKSVCAICVHTK